MADFPHKTAASEHWMKSERPIAIAWIDGKQPTIDVHDNDWTIQASSVKLQYLQIQEQSHDLHVSLKKVP